MKRGKKLWKERIFRGQRKDNIEREEERTEEEKKKGKKGEVKLKKRQKV